MGNSSQTEPWQAVSHVSPRRFRCEWRCSMACALTAEPPPPSASSCVCLETACVWERSLAGAPVALAGLRCACHPPHPLKVTHVVHARVVCIDGRIGVCTPPCKARRTRTAGMPQGGCLYPRTPPSCKIRPTHTVHSAQGGNARSLTAGARAPAVFEEPRPPDAPPSGAWARAERNPVSREGPRNPKLPTPPGAEITVPRSLG